MEFSTLYLSFTILSLSVFDYMCIFIDCCICVVPSRLYMAASLESAISDKNNETKKVCDSKDEAEDEDTNIIHGVKFVNSTCLEAQRLKRMSQNDFYVTKKCVCHWSSSLYSVFYISFSCQSKTLMHSTHL